VFAGNATFLFIAMPCETGQPIIIPLKAGQVSQINLSGLMLIRILSHCNK
jgi:hypothetical protein